jgi:hypothetical protein
MITMAKFDERLRWYHILIHRAIHDKTVSAVTLEKGKRLFIKPVGGMRSVAYDDMVFVEQNPNKSSEHALAARAGKHITWGITVGQSPWLYIDDDIATRFEACIHDTLKTIH